MNDKLINTNAEAMAKYLEDHAHGPQVLVVEDQTTGLKRYLTAVPDRMTAKDVTDDLKKLLPAPERRTGVIQVQSVDAFLAMVNRHKDACSVIYADDAQQPIITAVLNDHYPEAKGTPGFRDHRIVYQPALSDEWNVWVRFNNKAMTSETFAELLEDRALDLVDPRGGVGAGTKKILDALNVEAAPPARISGLARNLTVCVNSKVKDHRNLQSGEGQILFEASHTDEAGKPLDVPGAFLVGIPIYKGGPGYLFVARLRYKVKDGSVFWTYLLSQTDLAKRETMSEMIRHIQADTGVIVVEGKAG